MPRNVYKRSVDCSYARGYYNRDFVIGDLASKLETRMVVEDAIARSKNNERWPD